MLKPLLLCLLLWPMAVSAQETAHITVTGEGTATAVPDMAEITLGVVAQNATAAAAMAEASAVTQAIFDTLPRFGIAPSDVQTSDLSLAPLYDQRMSGEAPRVTGYQAANRVTVRVRALDRLGPVLDAVLDSGANRMDGLRFSVSDPAPLLDRARRRAVEDARRRAETYAQAAGLTLGPVLSITEGGATFGPEPMFEMARSSAVPIAAGETELRASVTMRFALE